MGNLSFRSFELVLTGDLLGQHFTAITDQLGNSVGRRDGLAHILIEIERAIHFQLEGMDIARGIAVPLQYIAPRIGMIGLDEMATSAEMACGQFDITRFAAATETITEDKIDFVAVLVENRRHAVQVKKKRAAENRADLVEQMCHHHMIRLVISLDPVNDMLM